MLAQKKSFSQLKVDSMKVNLKIMAATVFFIKTKEVLSVGEMITVVDPHPDGGNKKRKGKSNEKLGRDWNKSCKVTVIKGISR